MVSFFVPALKHTTPVEQTWRYTWDLTGSLAVELFPFLLDAASLVGNGRAWAAILLPAILGLVYTFKGGAVVLPAYWLFSVLIRSIQHSVNGSIPSLPSTSAVQATAFAVAAGYILPSMMMLTSPTPRMIAAWVGFPFSIALAQILFYGYNGIGARLGFGALLPYLQDLTSYQLVQSAYTLFAIFSFATHLPLIIGILLPNIAGIQLPSSPTAISSTAKTPANILSTARHFLIPHLSVFQYSSRDELFERGIADEVLRFLQWDLIFIALGTWLAGSWTWAFPSSLSTQDILATLRVVVVSLAGCFFFGPGVVVAGVWMVKEQLEEELRVEAKRIALGAAAAGLESARGVVLPWVFEQAPALAYRVLVG